jgi:hypothetical protein
MDKGFRGLHVGAYVHSKKPGRENPYRVRVRENCTFSFVIKIFCWNQKASKFVAVLKPLKKILL